MQRETPDGGPEVQGITVSMAGEAAVDLAGEMDGEGPG